MTKSFSHILANAPAALFLLVLPLNHTNTMRLMMLFLCGLIALHHALKQPLPPFPAKLPLTLWAGLALLSAIWSADPHLSLGEFKTEIVYGMIAFAAFFVLTRDKTRWLAFLGAVLLGTLVTALIAVTHFALNPAASEYTWEWQHGFVSYSTYLATIAPLLLYALFRPWGSRWVRPAALLMLLPFLFVAYKTGNRMFWLSLCASGGLFFALIWLKQKNRREARWIALSALVGIAGVAFMFVTVAQQRLVDPLQHQSHTQSALAHASATLTQSERYEIWSYWIEHIREKPWSGVGFGRDLPHLIYEKPPHWFGLMFAHAHNLFLNYALQLGIPGVMVLLVLLGALAREFLRLYRDPQQDAWVVGACGLSVLVAMASKNLTDDLFWRTDALLFWALMGMLLGYGSRLRQHTAMARPRP